MNNAARYPDDRGYHEEHDWALVDGEAATFGVTWYAQDALGEIVFFNPPKVGDAVTRGESYAELESVKAVSDVIAPMSGEIVEVNEALADQPELVNSEPYGGGWLVRVRVTDPAEVRLLLPAQAYEQLVGDA